MEKYKLENFQKEYGGKKLNFIPLGSYEVQVFKNRLRNELSVESELSLLSLWEILESTKFNIDTTDNLSQIFKNLKINISNDVNVYVIWNLNNEIDFFKYEELSQYWEDIWYDTSDELVLLYAQGFYILISEWGEIRYINIFDS